MPENEERVGFEAYFETKEFEDGIKRFQSGLDKAGKSSDNFIDKILNLRKTTGSTLGPVLGGIVGSLVPSLGTALGTAIGGVVGPLLSAFDPINFILEAISGNLVKVGETGFSVFGLLGKVGSSAFKVIGVALKAVTAGITGLIGLVTGGLVAGFLLFRRTAQQAFAAIANKFGDFIESAVELQRVDVGIQSLVRSVLVAEGSFERASDAMDAAIPIANDLMEALQQMAMRSPFSLEYINLIFRTNMAYGLSVDASYRLTDAIMQVGAATGFSAEVLERISRNFAQVAKNGKILQRDITELSNAGLSMYRILDEELNMSVDEFNQGVQKGTVSMDDLIEALISFSQKNFEGSVEALAMAVDGLRTRFHTISAVIAKDFVTPLIKLAAPALNTLMDALTLVVTTDVFSMFGQTFANMAQRVVGDMDWTTETIAQKIMDLLLWVANAASDMFRWGYETFIGWGKGALKGAATAISAVANFISRAISSLFSTHSPPAILPMIDVWGAETIEAWLEGMTHADFSILNDIVDQVESVLEALDFESLDIGSILQTMVQDVSLGGIENIFANITDQLGPFANVLQELINLNVDLTDANADLEEILNRVATAMQDVAREEEILADITKRYEAALKDVNDQQKILEDILDRQKTAQKDVNAQQKILDGILDRKKVAQKDVNAQQKILDGILDRQKIAQKDVNAQQKILKGILDRKKVAQKDVNAQQKILEEITDRQTEAQKRLNEQEKILEDRTWAVKIAQEALEDAMDFYDDSDEAVQRLVREYNALLRAGAGDAVLDAKLAEIKAMQLQRQEAANLIDDAEEQVDVAEDAKFAQEQVIRGYKDAVDAIKEEADAQREVIDNYQDIVDAIEEEADAQRDVIDGYQEIVDAIQEEADAQREIIDGYQDIVDAIEEEADAQRDIIDGYQDIVDGIQEEADAQRDIIDGYQDIADAIKDEMDDQQEIIDGYQDIVDAIEDEADAQRDIIDAIEDQITAQEDLIDLMLKLTGYTEDEDKALSGLADTLEDTFAGLTEGLGGWEFEGIDTSALDSSLGEIELALGEVEAEWDTLVTAAETAWEELTGENGPFANAWEDVKNLLGFNKEENWQTYFEDSMYTVEQPMQSTLFAKIRELLTNFFIELKGDANLIDAIKGLGISIIDGILKGVEDRNEEKEDSFKTMIVDFLIGKARKALGIGGDTSEEARKEIGKPIVSGIIQGIKDGIGMPSYVTDLVSFGNWAFDVMKGWFGIDSPSSRAKNEIGVEITNGIVAGITERFAGLIVTAQELWENFKIGLGDFWTNAYNIGKAIVHGLGQGIGAMFADLSAKAGEVWENFKIGIGNAFENAKSIGVSIIEGIKAGVDSMPNLLGWASGVAGKIIQAIKNALGANSPSEEAEEEIGVPVTQGIFKGINKGINDMQVQFMMESPSKLMEEQVGIPLMQGVLEGFNAMKGAITSGMADMLNYTPTPTNSYTPSAITNNSIINNMYMGNNTVRSDMDIAIIQNTVRQAIRNASHSL